MNVAEVQELVGSWVEGVVGITTIDAWPNEDAPTEPYVVVTPTISDRVHLHPAGETLVERDGGVVQTPNVEFYWRFAIDAFGSGAEDHLRKIHVAWDVPTAMWPLRPLVLVEVSRIMTVADIRDQFFAGRANVNIEVRGIVRQGLAIDSLETVPTDFVSVD